MSNKDVALAYTGFTPTEEMKSLVHRKVEQIYGSSPYGSRVSATFTHQQNEFKADLRIRSQAENFTASAAGSSLAEVVQSLVSEINLKLSLWKTQRFVHRIAEFPAALAKESTCVPSPYQAMNL